MGGKSTSETKTQQSATTVPWEPTQGLLGNIITGLEGQVGNVNPTAAEQGAINTIQQNAQTTPNYGSQATDLTNSLFSGGPDRTGVASNAYSTLQNQLMPTANGANLDPTQAPGMQSLLDTIRSDVMGSVNGMFAGAGRDLSGANQQSLARGLSQGLAAPLLAQYNQNVANQQNAANSLFGAGANTAGILSGLDQTALGNKIQGLTTMQSIPAAANNGANAVLQAGQIQRGLPLNNLGLLANLTIPIAGLGSQSTGTGTSNTTNQMSGAQQFGLITGGLGSLFRSDRRTKDDIVQIGELYDGTPVYRFRYKGEARVNIGLMADEVEQYAPEAVHEIDGIKMVDYGAATERAARAR